MRALLTLFAVVTLAAVSAWSPVAAAQDPAPVRCYGIDYGLVHMVGTEDFRDPGAIFPGYLDKWNVLLRDEQVDDLNKRLKRTVTLELEHLASLHRAANPETQIVRNDLIGITKEYLAAPDIEARVRSYQLQQQAGLGLVFIADQLNKPERQGCYWVTFFDAGTKQVKSTERRCGRASGFGFRNYWFGTIKDVISSLRPGDVRW